MSAEHLHEREDDAPEEEMEENILTAVVVDNHIICLLMRNGQLGYDTIISSDTSGNVFMEQTPLDVIDDIKNNSMCYTLLGCEKDFLNNTQNQFTIKCNFSLCGVVTSFIKTSFLPQQ